MSFLEGSVTSEDSDIDEAEETQDESEEADSTDNTEAEASKTEETEDKTEESTEGTLKKQELTEKGTKLAEDPLSRVNQELANERAKIRQYEQLLNDPKQIKAYAAQFDKENERVEEEPEMRVEDIHTTEDLQKYQRQQDRKVEAKLKELDSTISSVKSTQKDTQIGTRIQNEIATVRETYPELDPKSASYNPELDKAVGRLFDRFDGDVDQTGRIVGYKGEASLKDIADIVMSAAGSSKKQGSTEAQTIIRDKRTGKAVSGSSSNVPDESKMTAGQLIAHRMRMARGGR